MRQRSKHGNESSGFPSANAGFSCQTFLWVCNLHQDRYNFLEPVLKKEIPDNTKVIESSPASNIFEGINNKLKGIRN
jgi:hypothetical protein